MGSLLPLKSFMYGLKNHAKKFSNTRHMIVGDKVLTTKRSHFPKHRMTSHSHFFVGTLLPVEMKTNRKS